MPTKTEQATTETSGSVLLGRGVKILGEAGFVPGSSLLLEGKVTSGAVHAAVGLAARSLLGPIGWALVAANSYATSVNGKGLIESVGGKDEEAKAN